MLSNITQIFMVILLGFTILTHVLKIIGLVTAWPIIVKLGLNKPPGKIQRFLYYLLTILSCSYAINMYLDKFK